MFVVNAKYLNIDNNKIGRVPINSESLEITFF